MMRENMGLHRGKRKDTGEWVGGYLAGYDLICPGEPQDVSHATGKYYGETPYVGFIEVDPSTVGRYTGLEDKRAKRIFENDTVRFKRKFVHGGAVVRIGRIVYDERNARFHISDSDGYICWDIYEVEDIEVVHDNPELLEVNEDD